MIRSLEYDITIFAFLNSYCVHNTVKITCLLHFEHISVNSTQTQALTLDNYAGTIVIVKKLASRQN